MSSTTLAATRNRRAGLLCLVATTLGWGINWPLMKLLLAELPPLTARGWSGFASAALLVALALARGESLAVPRDAWGRLALAAFCNVTAAMGLATVAMLWLTPVEGAMLLYTMPIWAMLLAWPMLGERPTRRGVAALALGIAGILLLFGGNVHLGAGKAIGVAVALTAAVLFGLGTVRSRTPLPLPPFAAVAWQVGLGCLPLVLLGLVLETPALGALSAGGWACWAYMALVPMGTCYIFWFAALRRIPAATASMATLSVPVIGVLTAYLAFAEPVGPRAVLAMALTLSGVALALRRG